MSEEEVPQYGEIESQEYINDKKQQFDKEKFFTFFGMWLSLSYSTLFEIIGTIVGVGILLIATFTGFVEMLPDGTIDQNSDNAIIILLVINSVASVILGALVIVFNKKSSFIASNRSQKLTKQDGKTIMVALSFMFFLIAGLELVVSLIVTKFFPDFMVETPYDFFDSDNIIVLIVAMVSVTVFAPIVEELFFRKTMMDTLGNGMNKYATIIFSALVFSLSHSLANLSYSFFYFVFHLFITLFLGIIFGIVYYNVKKISSTIILHAIWNFLISLGALFYYFNLDLVYDVLYFVLIGLGGVLSITYTIIYFVKKSREEKERHKIKIKLKGEWFIFIAVFALTIVILPFLILKLTEYFSFGEGFISLLYLGVVLLISAIFVSKYYREYQTRAQLVQYKLKV